MKRLLLLLLATAYSLSYAGDLETLSNCTYVATDWGDGDSFLVRTSSGKELSIRLYGADCPEWHVTDSTDGRRLLSQRRHFGVADIEVMKGIGSQAKDITRELLAKPFKVHTTYADGRGDSRFARVYAFVTTADGEDLASLLVRRGLARAFGVCRETPTGASLGEYRDRLKDLELLAAKRGVGAWKLTDWERLLDERKSERRDEAEIERAQGRGPLPPDFVIDPNRAARDELMRLPGIGEKLALRIVEDRPYARIEDLTRVPGVGAKTLERIRQHLKIER